MAKQTATTTKSKERRGLPAINLPAMTPAEREEFRTQMSADARDASARVVPTAQWISIKGRNATLGGLPIEWPLTAIIVEFGTERAYYTSVYDENNPSTPDCWAVTTANPKEMRPSDQSTDRQSDQCATCPHNAFGSQAGRRGKECSEHRRLALAVLQTDGPPDMRGLKVPPTSLRFFDNYILNDLKAAGGLPVYAVFTEISWSKVDKLKNWPAVEFKVVDQIPEEYYGLIKSIQPAARELVMQPFQAQAQPQNGGGPKLPATKGKGMPKKRKF